jgi:hypothetical protein
MENHTKRIRKARRQGLARKKDFSAPNPRLQVRGQQTPADGTPQDPPANSRRKSTLTQRKTEREARNTTRRITGRRVRK